MEIESVRLAIEQANIVSIGIGFISGLVFSFNPVAFAAIPVSLAYVTRARDRKTALIFGGMFILGLIVTHVLMGLIAGLGGSWIDQVLGRFWGVFIGPLLIVLGMVWAGWLRFPLPVLTFKAKRATSAWGAFGLGIPFSIAVCPFCTPVLIVILGVIASIGSPLLGVLVLFAFAVGRSIPIALGAWTIGTLESIKGFSRFQRTIDILGGLILILSGLYMLNAYFFAIPILAI